MVIRNSKIVSTALGAALIASMLATGGTVAAQGKSGEVSIQSATQQYKAVTVIIDGKVQQFPQSAVVKDGSTLVPLRGIFEALGAKVLWNEASHSVTATKGDTVIKLTVDQRTAYINDRAIELSAQAQTLNGSTMVPLRFVSEALGADVKWNGDTYTATITSKGGSGQANQGSGQVVFGIKVKYGKHHYGSKNQAEYDEVMAVLEQEVTSRLKTVKVGGDRYAEYYESYWDGDRASNYERNTIESMGLTSAEKNFKTLVDLGLEKEKIMDLMKLSIVGVDLIGTSKVIDDGSPNSLADLLIRGVRDCDPEAYLYSAIFDMYGYNTAVIAGDNHASAFVQINGEWVAPMNGTFAKSDVAYLLSQPGFYFLSPPTFGGTIK
ncbi:stalk domain-containing protein [Paenibacillus sp. MSJ-34]|uniref:stalk domain-containing protein n=1 Tax=Paenibacillus sp. MSJ-34 TaxID=2841529 RepID=UPI0020A06A34|nr:stalk domain-containing protein [Paenibacillus sp. MSJ-34]